MTAATPAPLGNPLLLLWEDMRADRAAEGPWPPGETRFSMARTRHFEHDPLDLLVSSYERYGPVFTLKIFHHNAVFMLGPEANHYMLVSHASNFRWREGHFRDLIPLLGDGLLTIDGQHHRTHRKLMLPAFHRERIESATVAMREEVDRALEAMTPGAVINLYDWTRSVALRVALRALFGFDPDVAQAGGLNAAAEFESALSFYSRDYLLQILRGPRQPVRQDAALAPPPRSASSTQRSDAGARAASGARTSSRCCSTPPTRTAPRSATARSATRS